MRAQGDEIERARQQLARSGPDGKEAREGAIERLLARPTLAAHAVLHACFDAPFDPDGLKLAICQSLQRHLLLPVETQFGGARNSERERILAGHTAALTTAWRESRGSGDPSAEVVRAAARTALQRVPARELDTAARALLASQPPDRQVEVLRCLADMQQTLFAATIAECLEAADPTVRAGARDALQLLICAEEPIRNRAEFAAWHATFGSWRYVDLVERAARLGGRPFARLQEENARLRVDVARDVVRAHVTRSPGIDWAAVQARVIVDDSTVLDACLELLQQALPTVNVDDAAPSRQAFCRALLQRYRQVAPDQVRRRALLLEVAAHLARGDETELATELVGLLLGQLDAAEPEMRLAVLRGLRRFPSAEVRARLVGLARTLLEATPVARDELAAIVAALTARTAPRWTAPLPTDPDKAAWLELMRALCHSDEALGLREPALAMGQMLDAREQRVPEVFALLTLLVRDSALATKLRSTAAIHLQGWQSDRAFVEEWVEVWHQLLQDPTPALRQQAAESLSRLTESVDQRRADWLSATILVMRERLVAETDPDVFRALVECVQVLGREPGMPALALAALRWPLETLGSPLPADSQFRLEPLLSALATVGSDPRADRGQWLTACQPLALNRRRQGLRLILVSHAAIDLAKDVNGADATLADRARHAMGAVIDAALLKPAREAWTSSPELLREARDVRTAFVALDSLDVTMRPDLPSHRVLRLEVELATGKYQEVVQRANGWLAAAAPRGSMTEDDLNRIRVLAAEAQLALLKPEVARRLMEERTGDPVTDAATLDLEARIGRALVPTDLAGAVELLGRVYRRTAVDDTTFRARLVEWMQLRIRLDPALREDTLREGDQHAALFQAPDCPSELREAFEQVHASR